MRRASPAGYTSRTAKYFSPAQKKPAEASCPLWESLLFLRDAIERRILSGFFYEFDDRIRVPSVSLMLVNCLAEPLTDQFTSRWMQICPFGSWLLLNQFEGSSEQEWLLLGHLQGLLNKLGYEVINLGGIERYRLHALWPFFRKKT